MKRLAAAFALLFTTITPSFAAKTLKVVKAGPVGEVATLAEANEVRVVLSEPMVVVGKIPATVTAPFFKIEPPVAGTFRWSGTTTLIFTPDPKKRLPYATKYTVSIDETATSVAGNTLDRPYRFSFTTPTIRLLSTGWYRKGAKPEGPVVIGLRFNQPIDAASILPHLQLRTVAHTLEPPVPPAKGRAWQETNDPAAVAAYQAKWKKSVDAAAQEGAVVFVNVATDWNKERFAPGKDLLVLETRPGVPSDIHLRVYIDGNVARGAEREGRERSGRAQEFVIALEPAFFVQSIACESDCDPEFSNTILFRGNSGVDFTEMKRATTVTDITEAGKETLLEPVDRARTWDQIASAYSLDELGYSLLPARRYRVRIDPSLTAADGQKLGYTWVAEIEYSHKFAFISFGDGHGVWEADGGNLLPFHARNYRSVQQWLAPLDLDRLMPAVIQMQSNAFQTTPPAAKVQTRRLNVTADKIQSHGLDIAPVTKNGRGLLWAAMKPGETIAGAKKYDEQIRATIVQATNLGITVKDSPQNTLVFVTQLDNAAPVSGATVSIRRRDNKVLWNGTTDARGLAMAPAFRLREKAEEKRKPEPVSEQMTEEEGGEGDWFDAWSALGELHFIVTAQKDGDVAYVASDWNDGIQPWEFEVEYNLFDSYPLLRGSIFADRGVYKPGEEVHLKAIVRSDTPDGMQLLPAGTKIDLMVRDSHNQEVDRRSVALNEWSSVDWTMTISAGAPLGHYTVRGTIEGQKLQVTGGFLVAAYRRPEFRVETTLTGSTSVAGVNLDGRIVGRYLFGAPMSGRDVKWTYTKRPVYQVPESISEKWPADRFAFLGWDREQRREKETISSKEEKLDARGTLQLSLPTNKAEGWPYEYTLEGDVIDVTRQHIANRATFRVDPAPWYIGVKRPPYFADSTKGIDTELIAASMTGALVPGVNVTVDLKQLQWISVRKSHGGGFYEWESEQKEVPRGEWTITTQMQPVPLHVSLPEGGEYVLTATAKDGQGRSTTTRVWFYAAGGGYTAWQRYDHNRIDLVADKTNLKPGDVAKVLVKSPWEKATALLTTEREGIRSTTPFELTSTNHTLTIPVTEKDIPNLFVSVLLIKGRTKEAVTEDSSDPGKPAFRLGYIELKIDDETKRLRVSVKANRDEYRPASKARIEVEVRDVQNKPSPSEVTLWAVDYGVLSLTAYQPPDVLSSIYLEKALQVATIDSRQKIISRRVLTPKGATDGGGGGADAGPGVLRKDFRVLAFWLGSVVTDKNGKARTEVTLPESLTTYRIMAVASDKQSRFGNGQAELRINKPVMITQSFPRFLAVGDRAFLGGVVRNQLRQAATPKVTIRSLDPDVLEIVKCAAEPCSASGAREAVVAEVQVPAGGSAEVRFDAFAKSVGDARVQLSVAAGKETDAFEDVIPVRVLVSPETVAAHGEATPRANETLQLPADVIPGFGGLTLEMASTAMVGLSEGARYLIDYPYGCAEQRASSALALMLTSHLGDAFEIPNVDAARAKSIATRTLEELKKFQCGDGGFAFWPGDCQFTSPYLTSYVVHVYQRAKNLGYVVDAGMLNRAYEYLERSLGEKRPENEGWLPAYTAWQAFAVKTLAEGGRNVDSHVTRLFGYVDRMPIFGLSFLADALLAKNDRGERLSDLHRRMSNAILPESSTAHVEELNDPYLLWFWNSNVRSTAIVLGTLVRHGTDEEIVKRMVRWLMRVRKNGRWGNTQENAWAMGSLVEYFTKYEKEVPDFTGVVTLGGSEIAREVFKGRTTDTRGRSFSMRDLLARGKAGQTLPVTFERQGVGTLFYGMRLRYASDVMGLTRLDQGFALERSYAPGSGGAAATTFAAGELIKVTLTIRNTKERRYVAITDPIPAGTEPVESWFATTATELAEQQRREEGGGVWAWWQRGGFDHIERHDDRVQLFATRLGEGTHTFSYMLRATTAGSFVTAPLHAEQMYEPEVFGRTATVKVEVKK